MRNRFFIFATTLLLLSCWNNKTGKQQETEETEQENLANVQFTESCYNRVVIRLAPLPKKILKKLQLHLAFSK